MPVKNKEEIFAKLNENRPIVRNFGVNRVALFGSFLRRQQTPQSDIDLLVEFRPGRKYFVNFMNLASFLEDLFGRRVELVTPESLSPHIGPKIMREIEYAVTD